MSNKNKGGRPLKFKSPEELESRIEEYFIYAKDNKEVPTVSGLAWYLDTNRQTLLKYGEADCDLFKNIIDDDVKVMFADTIKRAKARIEAGYEQTLFNKNSAVGGIFTLKNNYNWVDKTEQVVENKTIEVTLED
ncbi:terminase small subunit [Clostridium sp.]|uniref:terminase small subunit n=1 Tax=Clostridium sp. TaxID=1506 RepID=UPI0032170448